MVSTASSARKMGALYTMMGADCPVTAMESKLSVARYRPTLISKTAGS